MQAQTERQGTTIHKGKHRCLRSAERNQRCLQAMSDGPWVDHNGGEMEEERFSTIEVATSVAREILDRISLSWAGDDWMRGRGLLLSELEHH